ncbi:MULTISPECIES: hypothetical protein [unclassified Caballeronia]|uniref:hypothetical protein n=1 Tax=unclassified Caballeronia TaxID=2646786 RepID=UPI0028567EB3|nr:MULTISPECIES: hypothetical protein [unclassified Caballeronia]MDR5740819.1 hypothetical protein [Caballeronia sp. LZ016]MDR5808660.1 hypothetical protein [Caballeronia sp. LZ019]
MSTGHDDLDAWKRQRTVTLAFELADSGRCEHFGDIAYTLQFERGLSISLIDDPAVRRQLNERCADAREALAPEPEPPEAPETVTTRAQTPSLLRRAASALRRSGTLASGLRSAAS